MKPHGRNTMQVDPSYQWLMRELGLDCQSVFTHPRIHAWRTLPERDNATLDATGDDGRAIRLHIKRHAPATGRLTPAELEARGIRLLQSHGIATVPLVAWGGTEDGRSFVITEDLGGYVPADQWITGAERFDRLLEPSAQLAASLHNSGLHHRDFYLCHLFVKQQGDELLLRLIDAGRVKTLPRWFMRRRWVVKDLAQFWYSTLSLNITDNQRTRWITRYAELTGCKKIGRLVAQVQSKSARIARHDKRLRARQPGRNISING